MDPSGSRPGMSILKTLTSVAFRASFSRRRRCRSPILPLPVMTLLGDIPAFLYASSDSDNRQAGCPLRAHPHGYDGVDGL